MDMNGPSYRDLEIAEFNMSWVPIDPSLPIPGVTPIRQETDEEHVAAMMRHIEQEIAPVLWDSYAPFDHKADDVHHVHECHVAVCLREAEELSDNGDVKGAMDKVVSAIGSAAQLHRRLQERLI